MTQIRRLITAFAVAAALLVPGTTDAASTRVTASTPRLTYTPNGYYVVSTLHVYQTTTVRWLASWTQNGHYVGGTYGTRTFTPGTHTFSRRCARWGYTTRWRISADEQILQGVLADHNCTPY